MNKEAKKKHILNCRLLGFTTKADEAASPENKWDPYEASFPNWSEILVSNEGSAKIIPDNVPKENHLFISSVEFKKGPKEKTYKVGKDLQSDEDVVEFIEMLGALQAAFSSKICLKRKQLDIKTRLKNIEAKNIRHSSNNSKNINSESTKSTVEQPISTKENSPAANLQDSESSCDTLVTCLGDDAPINDDTRSPTIDDEGMNKLEVVDRSPKKKSKLHKPQGDLTNQYNPFPVAIMDENPKFSDLEWAAGAAKALKNGINLVKQDLVRKKLSAKMSFAGRNYIREEDWGIRENIVAMIAHQNFPTSCFLVVVAGKSNFYKMKPSTALAISPSLVKSYYEKADAAVLKMRHQNKLNLRIAYEAAKRILSGENIEEIKKSVIKLEQEQTAYRLKYRRNAI